MAPRAFATRLTRRAARGGLSLNDELVEKLDSYFALLARWNEKINLTSLDDLDEVIDRLMLEPLMAARYVPAGARWLMDVGSGGGSPAIPLKLVLPRLGLTMVESKTRKSAFLREAARQLELAETVVETARVEELLTRADLSETFDVISLRAVRVDTKGLHTLQAFLAPMGEIFMFRGASGPDEPGSVVPPLQWHGTYPLVDSLRSRLTVLSKIRIGRTHVPRETPLPY